MFHSAVCLGCLLALVMETAARSAALQQGLEMNLKERPVMKVVRLLQDMQAQLQKDLDDDKAVHELLSCWCKTNDQEKTAAIDLGEQKVEQLKATMSEMAAKIVELKAKRKATMDEMYSDQKALDTATALRMKETQAFHGEETALLDAVNAAKQAIVVLSKHNPELAQLRALAKHLQEVRIVDLVSASTSLRRTQQDMLKQFLQRASAASSSSSFLRIPGFQSYAPKSGQIFGILKQMLADFKESLSEAQAKELQAKEEYQALKAAKLEEIEAAKKAVEAMDVQMADATEKEVQAAQELEDVEAQLGMDREFLAKLKKKCTESDAEYDTRVKDRTEEIIAVQDTIKILNSDEAFDNFDKTVNTAFLQTASVSSSEEQLRRQRAAQVLREADMLSLATAAELDAFTKVKEAIDKMVVELKTQQADEVKQRDWCKDELANNDRETAAADDKKVSLEMKIADLEKTIETLKADIESTKASIAEVQVQMKKSSEIREGENADYQQTVTDHRLTQMILDKALARMQEVYAFLENGAAQQPGAPHIETSGNHTDPGNGPARFTKYEKHAGGSRVVQMLKTIIADSKKTENDAIASEEDAQTAYETFMKDSNKGISASLGKINRMTAALASSKESLSLAETDLKGTMEELQGLSSMAGDLHKSCDFLLKNFDARQQARSAEIEALGEAKAILSGSK